ncbi:MAG: hypothetical protein IKG30_05925 [Clostridiales bacterium]|nr:hypothetical protein [Clostridiales bacterium]
MERAVNVTERQIILDNPELVMFNPYKGWKPHRRSVLYAFIPSVIAFALIIVPVLLFPGFVSSIEKVYVGVSMVIFFASIFAIPFVFVKLDDRDYNKNLVTHYGRQLKALLPGKLWCNIVTIENITVEKAEGVWIIEGESVPFGYASYVNCFRMEPGMEMAVVYDRNGFEAYIKRDVRTESFYCKDDVLESDS